MVDTHTHLNSDEFELNRTDILQALKINKIKALIVGTNLKDSLFAKNIVKDYSNLKFSVGIHPHSADEVDLDSVSEEFVKLILDPNNVAIGECGFDFYYNSKQELYKKQEDLFRMQIELAKEYNKPLIIHTRESFQETYNLLNHYKDLKIVYHCFTGDVNWFHKLNSLPHQSYFSFSGIITFKNNVSHIQNSAKEIPMEQILSETDSPYLSPVPFRGQRNTSMNIKYIVQKIAELKNVSVTEMEAILDKNASKVFNL